MRPLAAGSMFLVAAVLLQGSFDAQKRNIPEPCYEELHYVIVDSTPARSTICTSVGSISSGNDLGTISLEQRGGMFSRVIFADFICGRPPTQLSNAGENLCAARDLSTTLSPGAIGLPAGTVNWCTGMVAIGKVGPKGLYVIDFDGFNCCSTIAGIDETCGQEISGFYPTIMPNGTSCWLDPITGSAPFIMPTVVGRPDAMDVAIGYTTNPSPPPPSAMESWLIVSERVGTFSSLVAYYLSSTQSGGCPYTPPSPASAIVFSPPTSPTTMNITHLGVASSPQARSNTVWVVFVDSGTAGNPIAHTIPFTLGFGGGGSVWGTLDPQPNPYNIPIGGLSLKSLLGGSNQGTVCNMWEAVCPDPGSPGDFLISIRNNASPFSSPGNLVVLRAGGPGNIGIQNAGGGPVSHVSSKSAVVQGVALEVGSPPAPMKCGWYVVTPVAAGVWVMNAMDRNGNVANVAAALGGGLYQYTYPGGAVPAGVPMAHPGDLVTVRPPPFGPNTNFVAIPYWDGGASTPFRFDIYDGSQNINYTLGPPRGVPFTVVTNYGTFPAFPTPHQPPGSLWQGNLVIKAFTNFKPEYTVGYPWW